MKKALIFGGRIFDVGKRVAYVTASVMGARKTKRGRVVPLSTEALRIINHLAPGFAHADGVLQSHRGGTGGEALMRRVVQVIHHLVSTLR